MKSKEEFKRFFDQEILEDLQELDRRIIDVERKVLKWRIYAALGLLLLIGLFILRAYYEDLNSYLIIFAFIFTAYFFLTAGQMKGEISTKNDRRYKWQILPYALENIFDSVNYIPNQFISIKAIRESRIFGEHFDFDSGEDYFKCELNDVTLQFSEISILKKPLLLRPIEYKGIFFISEFNKNFNTATLIMPASLLGISNAIYRSIIDLEGFEKVHLEDPVFNKEYVVFAQDQVESRYILTPAFMNNILNLKELFSSGIIISFSEQRLNIFIENNSNLFEPPMFKPYADFEHFYKNISYFMQFASIVEELSLNVNIWGKH